MKIHIKVAHYYRHKTPKQNVCHVIVPTKSQALRSYFKHFIQYNIITKSV